MRARLRPLIASWLAAALCVQSALAAPRAVVPIRAAPGSLAPAAAYASPAPAAAFPALAAPAAAVGASAAAALFAGPSAAEPSSALAVDVQGGRERFDGQAKFESADSPVFAGSAIPGSGAAVAAPSPVPQGKRRVEFVYDPGGRALAEVRLKGSFDKKTGAYDPLWGGWGEGDSLPMTRRADGTWSASVDLDDDASKDWRWGVIESARPGEAPRWAVNTEGTLPLAFEPGARAQSALYSPTTFHRMGARRQGEDLGVRFWAPNAREVALVLTLPDGSGERHELRRDGELWSATLPKAWKRLEGAAYVYEITSSNGATLRRADPYARAMQGKQRGIAHLYVDAETAEQVQPFHFRDSHRPQTALTRLEVQPAPGDPETAPTLVLRDEDGALMTRERLLARLGRAKPAFAAKLRERGHMGYWAENVDASGRVTMREQGGAWVALFDHPEALRGLRYEFQDAAGRRLDSKNDPWSDLIEASSGKSFRGSLVQGDEFEWKWDDAPRERDPRKWRIYQAHVGSFMGRGQNARRSTFRELQSRLSYIKSLGMNAVELLPTGEFEDLREWGYGGSNSLAVESSYGYEESGRWVSGVEALKRLIDEAHRQGLSVIADVVYNHVGGKYDGHWQVSAEEGSDNFLWRFDGVENPWFNWAREKGKEELRRTPWGPVPAFNNPRVRQFLVDHIVYHAQALKFDGARFDFTEPIKNLGGPEGEAMLREMNRAARRVNPHFYTSAENFPYDENLTRPGSGIGFDQQWYTEFNHRLVHELDRGRPSILQEAARGERTVIDRFMDLLLRPWGIGAWSRAVAPLNNHDEVGNGDRTINIANGGPAAPLPSALARGLTKVAVALALLGPGTKMFFQGEEFAANNRFRWGNPGVWDMPWGWERIADGHAALKALAPAEREALLGRAAPPEGRAEFLNDLIRRLAYDSTKAVVALAAGSEAFDADATITPVYVHNDHSLLAFTRRKGADEYLVLASLSRQDWRDYKLGLPEGPWTQVYHSDAERFGGGDAGPERLSLAGGWRGVDMAPGSVRVFKRVPAAVEPRPGALIESAHDAARRVP